jgi:hypothetical protein
MTPYCSKALSSCCCVGGDAAEPVSHLTLSVRPVSIEHESMLSSWAVDDDDDDGGGEGGAKNSGGMSVSAEDFLEELLNILRSLATWMKI